MVINGGSENKKAIAKFKQIYEIKRVVILA